MSDTIIETTSGGVRVIRLNRPERMNSLGGTLLGDVVEAFIEGAANDAVRAFVVTGEGRAWCAGADLLDMGGVGVGGGPRNPRATALDDIGAVGRAVLAIYNCNKPTIAAVNGVAAGAGFSLALSCDMRIAKEGARLSAIFARRGIVADTGSTWLLPRIVGEARALEMLYSGRLVDAEEALRIGLVSEVVPADDFMERVTELARSFATGPSMAIELDKRLVRESWGRGLDEQIELEEYLQRITQGSEDAKEERRWPKADGH